MRGLVAAGAGAELDDDVLVVVGVFGQQQDLELFFDRGEPGLERGELFLRHGAEVGVGFGEHGLGFGDAVLDLAVLAKLFDGRLEVAVRLGDGLELLLVLDQRGVGHLAGRGLRNGLRVGRGGQTYRKILIAKSFVVAVVLFGEIASEKAQLGKVVTVGRLGHAGGEHRICGCVHRYLDVTPAAPGAECIF